MSMLMIHAPNTHLGGGRTLLLALLKSLPVDQPVEVALDQRMEVSFELAPSVRVHRVSPTIGHRFHAELRLRKLAGAGSQVLCFGNLPPLFRCDGHVCLFVQNPHLVFRTDLSQFPWRQRLRIHTERHWLRSRIRNADDFVVQTESMRFMLQKMVHEGAPIRVLPFVPNDLLAQMVENAPAEDGKQHDFCFVSTGEPHKNHDVLLQAWRQLAEQGLFPSLCLTLSPQRYPELCTRIEELKTHHQLKITNLGHVALEKIPDVYRNCHRLVFPSLHESFGLPLIEARRYGLPIAAPELDYVRDVVDPDVTFDPQSPRSLARAVQRMLEIGNSRAPLVDARTFLANCLTTRTARAA